ncbi:hypothetical protein V5O48_002894 [Marasmius crinis-equi]|uniref:Ribosome biogenesis protein SLX9 n=1 Tax=Marasmius crinis-equi TaxID=585013 RepID=A0ABR3FUD2_9AGAR
MNEPSSARYSRDRSSLRSILSTASTSRSPASAKYLDYGVGIGLLLVVVFLWTSSSFITQALFEGGYEKAFLVTYLNTSTFALYIIPYVLKRGIPRLDDQPPRPTNVAEYEPLVTDPDVDREEYPPALPVNTANPEDLPPLTTKETAKLAGVFCFFWFIANWTVNLSVDYTSVASATILASMSGFFTMVIGRLFQVEALTLAKIGAVLMSIAGTILVALSDNTTGTLPSPNALLHSLAEKQKSLLLGDALALTSAVFYAIYTITLKVGIKSESRIDMKLFFGFVGLFNIVSLWPIAILLHVTGLETFELPSNGKEVGGLLINMAITWSSDFLYVFAMLKTSPLVVTVGLSLTMPLAVVGDFFLGRPVPLQVIGGALLVLVSVVLVGMEDARILKQKEKEKEAEELYGFMEEPSEDVELELDTSPKDRSKRTAVHAPSAKLAKRQFAAPDARKIERVEIGSAAETSNLKDSTYHDFQANDLLAQPSVTETKGLKKQDKQALRREALLQRLELTQSPYSKSHVRRMKRKAREQIAGGLDDMQVALNSLDGAEADPPKPSDEGDKEEPTQPTKTTSKTKPGQIGEGKGATLSNQKRKQVLQAERLRHPLILQNPQFSSNPFQTIRTHAQNTLVKHAPPQS